MFGSRNMRTRVSIQITVEQSRPKIITKRISQVFLKFVKQPSIIIIIIIITCKEYMLFQMLLNNIISPFPRIVSFWKILFEELSSLRGDKNIRSYLPISIEKLRHPSNPITNPHERVKLVNIFILFFFPSLSFLFFFSPLSRHNSEFSEQ